MSFLCWRLSGRQLPTFLCLWLDLALIAPAVALHLQDATSEACVSCAVLLFAMACSSLTIQPGCALPRPQFFERLGLKKLRFKPAYNPYTEPSMEIFRCAGAELWTQGIHVEFRGVLFGIVFDTPSCRLSYAACCNSTAS